MSLLVPHHNLYISIKSHTDCISKRFRSHYAPAHVMSDVPQGSGLGPVPFLLDINDTADSISSYTRLFADDFILYREIQISEDCNILETNLNKLSE